MNIHKEGRSYIAIYLLAIILIYALLTFVLQAGSIGLIVYYAFALFGLLFMLNFFRNPTRTIAEHNNLTVYAPADGKVVAIEEVEDLEYFNEKRIQISIFMSVTSVHVNRNPIGGEVKYYQYHKGKYLVAWHPKSSTENERTTTVLSNGKSEVMIRQIAGAVARRIVNYVTVGEQVRQGADMGFIKFGSRVDLLLPLDATIHIKINEKVKGNQSIIASLAQ